jgi:hypothetical protein
MLLENVDEQSREKSVTSKYSMGDSTPKHSIHNAHQSELYFLRVKFDWSGPGRTLAPSVGAHSNSSEDELVVNLRRPSAQRYHS